MKTETLPTLPPDNFWTGKRIVLVCKYVRGELFLFRLMYERALKSYSFAYAKILKKVKFWNFHFSQTSTRNKIWTKRHIDMCTKLKVVVQVFSYPMLLSVYLYDCWLSHKLMYQKAKNENFHFSPTLSMNRFWTRKQNVLGEQYVVAELFGYPAVSSDCLWDVWIAQAKRLKKSKIREKHPPRGEWTLVAGPPTLVGMHHGLPLCFWESWFFENFHPRKKSMSLERSVRKGNRISSLAKTRKEFRFPLGPASSRAPGSFVVLSRE